jgi:hypothetical protein
VEALKESSSRFMRRMLPGSMLGLTFDGAGSAVTEKRKIQAKDSRSSMPLTMKWRYKRVWRKRALMLLVFTVALYQFYKAFEFNFEGVDLARVPGSWLGGSSDETGEPSSKYMRSTMEKKTSNSNPTGRANAPLSSKSKSKSKKQQRVKSSASKNNLHPITKGVLAVDTSLPVTAHPIAQLTESARKEWDSKVARQSKTLLQAVNEYKKRNRGRAPPKGFDKSLSSSFESLLAPFADALVSLRLAGNTTSSSPTSTTRSTPTSPSSAPCPPPSSTIESMTPLITQTLST